MALKFTANIGLGLSDVRPGNFGNLTDAFTLTRGQVLADSTAALFADISWYDTRTLTDAASETIDLHDGSLTDAFNVALTLDAVKAIYIKNTSDDAILLIGGAAANQLDLFADVSDIFKLRPGGELLIIAPDVDGIDTTVNAHLKLAHDGTGSSDLIYDIIIAGKD